MYLSPVIELEPDAAALLAARLDEDPNAAAVCPLVVDESGKPANDLWKLPDTATLKQLWRDPAVLPPVSPATEGESVPVEYAGFSALMARNFFIKGLNYFDARYGDFGADLDLAFHIRRSGRKLLLLPNARAKRHATPALPASANTILTADRANGVGVYLSKHYGFLAGLGFRFGAVLSSLVRFQFGVLTAVAGGSKIDGSQTSL